MDEKQVSIIILNWNNYADTEDCIKSISKLNYKNYRIIVVDNGSTDGSYKELIHEFEGNTSVEFIGLEKNYGFAGGVNRGILKSISRDSKYILLLNNDTVITDSNLLKELVSEYERQTDVGILTPVINKPNGDVWFSRGSINTITGETNHESSIEIQQNTGENDYVPFCAALISIDVILQVGLLDSRYFLYYEDVDYAHRLKQNGYSILTTFNTSIQHKASSSSGGRFSEMFSYYRSRNQILFRKKYKNEIKYRTILTWIWCIKAILDRVAHKKYSAALAIVLGMIDGHRGITEKSNYVH